MHIISRGKTNQGFLGRIRKDHTALGIEGLILGIHAEIAQIGAVLKGSASDCNNGQAVIICRDMSSVNTCIATNHLVTRAIGGKLVL